MLPNFRMHPYPIGIAVSVLENWLDFRPQMYSCEFALLTKISLEKMNMLIKKEYFLSLIVSLKSFWKDKPYFSCVAFVPVPEFPDLCPVGHYGNWHQKYLSYYKNLLEM